MTDLTPEQAQQMRQAYARNIVMAGRELLAQSVLPKRWAFLIIFFGDEKRVLRWAAKRVLNHMRHYCFADRPLTGTLSPNRETVLIREGRRQAFLEFMEILNLDESDVRKLKEDSDV